MRWNSRVFNLSYVSTKDQEADILTKALSKPAFYVLIWQARNDLYLFTNLRGSVGKIEKMRWPKIKR